MKQNIIMISILVGLFFLGLLIYDFSDELDNSITNHYWYGIQEKTMTVMDLKNQKFSYYYEDTRQPASLYDLSTTYRFNRSINVIKLNAPAKSSKLYIASVDEEKLVMTIAGEEKAFYASKEAAEEAAFITENNMTDEEFTELMNLDFTKYETVSAPEAIKAYKNTDKVLIALVNQTQSIKNALNLKALDSLINSSKQPLLVLLVDDISDADLLALAKLNKNIPSNLDEFDLNQIPVYTVGAKKFKLTTKIDITAFNELKNYNNA